MGTDDTPDDTLAAAAGDEPETVVVADSTAAADAGALAWSEGEPAALAEHRRWSDVRLVAASAAALAVVAGAAIWVWQSVEHRSAPPAPSSTAARPAPPMPSTAVTTAPPPAVTVTVTPPPAVTTTQAVAVPVPTLTNQDVEYLANLRNAGIQARDPSAAIANAHQFCAESAQGMSRDAILSEHGITNYVIVSYAIVTYCPQYAPHND